jgi:CHASE3 domain sensor protein
VRAKRWQRWSEVAPEQDYLRWARAGTVVATAFLLIVLVAIVVALVAH